MTAPLTNIVAIPRTYFAGGKNITPDSDTGRELGDLVLELQTFVNALNAIMPTGVLTEQGDVLYRNATIATRLAHGTAGQVLQTGGHGANPSWVDAILAAVFTERGDVLFRNATVPAALAHGTAGQALLTGGHGADPAWGDAILDSDVTTNGRMVRTGAGAYAAILDSLANTIAPTANNDASGGAGGKEKGFSVGSLWADATAKKAYICLDATNTAAVWREIDMGGVMTTTGDIITASAAGTPDRIAAGAVGTVMTGNGAGVKPSFQAVGGVSSAFVDAVVAVANAGAGATVAACTVQLNDLLGAPIGFVGEVLILAQSTQYAGRYALQTHVTFDTATVGSILASGAGWAVIKTSAAGAFACNANNASDETVYFSVETTSGGHDALAAGIVVRGCVPDPATWSA